MGEAAGGCGVDEWAGLWVDEWVGLLVAVGG